MAALAARVAEKAGRLDTERAHTVETLLDQIGHLQLERQELREREASREELEHNRRRLVACQWELAHAFIARYVGDAPVASPA